MCFSSLVARRFCRVSSQWTFVGGGKSSPFEIVHNPMTQTTPQQAPNTVGFAVGASVEAKDVNFNWKEYEKYFTSKKLRETLGDLAFPEDDVEVQIEKRTLRTTRSSVPESDENITDTWIQYCKQYFLQNWTVVNLTKTNKPVSKKMKFPDQLYEIDLIAKKDKEYLTPANSKEELQLAKFGSKEDAEKDRTKERIPIFTAFHMSKPEATFAPQTGRPYEERFGTQLLVEAKQLRFEFGSDIEPFFCTLAIYDLKNQRKVTENFHFNVNPPVTAAMMSAHSKGVDAVTLSQSCIFNITNPKNADLFLVLFINKVLSGESIDEHADMYCKMSMKDKDKTRFIGDTRTAVGRLGEYRQYFAWAAVRLFNDNGALQIIEKGTMNEITKVKGDLFDLLEDVKEGKLKKKRELIPGDFTFGIRFLDKTTDLVNKVTPSLVPVKPWGSDKDKVIREIQELPQEEHIPYPHVTYVNNLYFYPERLDFNNFSGTGVSNRNIAIEIKLMDHDDSPTTPGLKAIYGDSTSSPLVSKMTSVVWYHNKKPRYYDEIKIQLPTQLTPKHHILVTFYHIDCKPPKKSNKSDIATPIAFCFIPILDKNGHLINATHQSYPVATKLPAHYLKANEEDIPWIDKGKPLFTFSTRLVSSLYSLDQSLMNFFRAAAMDPSRNLTIVAEALKGLENCDKKELVRFFPVIAKMLFLLMAGSQAQISTQAFVSLLNVVDSVQAASTMDDAIVESYITYIFDPEPKDLLHEHIFNNWFLLIKEKHPAVKDTMKFAWFLYGLTIKSMVLTVYKDGKLSDDTTRPSRFTTQFVQVLQKVMASFRVLVHQYIVDPALSKQVAKLFNLATASFLTDLFAIMDRGIVFELIQTYVPELEANIDNPDLVEAKFTLIRTLINYIHYIPLNLPINPRIKTVADIPLRFWNKHFLSGLLLYHVETAFVSTRPATRLTAISTLCEALWKHDHDPRYQTPFARERIASIYFPFVLAVIDNWDMISKLPKSTEKRKILACFIYVVKGVSLELLKDYWERETERRIFIFFEILIVCANLFEYLGEDEVKKMRAQAELGLTKSQSPGVDPSSGSPDEEDPTLRDSQLKNKRIKTIKRKYGKKGPKGESPALEKKESEIMVMQYIERSTIQTKKTTINLSMEVKKEANFAREVSMVIFDTVLNFMDSFMVSLKRRAVFEKSFNVIITLLKKNQSLSFLHTLFQTLYWKISDLKKQLFRKQNSVCGEMCYEFLRYCNSRVHKLREEAAATYAILVESNFKETRNIARTRLQTTIAITKMVGQSEELDFERLQNSFSAVTRYFEKFNNVDALGVPIAKQLKELEVKIDNIIKDNKKMRQYQYDPEMMADLYYGISREFLESPDERITWLESLATFHKQNKQLEECAQCKVITAALVQEYLTLLDRWHVKTPTAYALVCPNIEKELTLPPARALQSLKDEICQSKLFTPEGFVGLLKEGIDMLKEGGFYESSVTAYRMMLPIFQEEENYQKQMECYFDLYNLCKSLVDEHRMNQRIFSNYYRVAFYGKKFGEMNGKEYIYKEMNTVRVADITEKLKKRYSDVFGEDKVQILGNKEVNPAELDPNMNYIQIGAVDLFLTKEEKDESLFKQHFGRNRFVMEQPFTKSGKAQGELEDQWIRRTIFTTEFKFPYLKKRVPVTSKEFQELTPIESAAMLIDKKIFALKAELDSPTPNPKTLQRELQGTLLTQVNVGPLAIAQIFLKDEAANKYPKEHREHLADLLMEFEKLLGFAVHLNKGLIQEDLIPLQEGLEEGYKKFCNELAKHKIFQQRRAEKLQQREKTQQEEAQRALKTLGEAEGEVKKKQKTGTGTTSQLKEALNAMSPPLSSIPEANDKPSTKSTVMSKEISSSTADNIKPPSESSKRISGEKTLQLSGPTQPATSALTSSNSTKKTQNVSKFTTNNATDLTLSNVKEQTAAAATSGKESPKPSKLPETLSGISAEKTHKLSSSRETPSSPKEKQTATPIAETQKSQLSSSEKKSNRKSSEKLKTKKESSASSNEENKKTKKSGEPKIAQKNDEGKKSPTAYSGNNKTDTVPSDSNQKLRSSASKVDSQKKEQAPLYSPKSEMTKESNMVATSQNQQWPPAAPPSKVVDDPQAKIAVFQTKISSVISEILSDLSDVALKILQAGSTAEAAKFISPIKTIKQELGKVKNVVELTFVPQPHSPRAQNEDELSYMVGVLSREIDNIRNQIQELKEKLNTVKQAQDLLTLGQFVKTLKVEVINALK